MVFTLPADLHEVLSRYLALHPGPLADCRGHQSAYARAVRAAQGRVTGTHGLRRLAAQECYAESYGRRLAEGLSPGEASRRAQEDAVERLGHSRDRADQRRCYLRAAG